MYIFVYYVSSLSIGSLLIGAFLVGSSPIGSLITYPIGDSHLHSDIMYPIRKLYKSQLIGAFLVGSSPIGSLITCSIGDSHVHSDIMYPIRKLYKSQNKFAGDAHNYEVCGASYIHHTHRDSRSAWFLHVCSLLIGSLLNCASMLRILFKIV